MKLEDIHYEIPDAAPDAENFDLEKWRQENPMDYLKAMFLINTSCNKNEVFLAIYRVARLHIPDALYKYYSLTNDIALNEQKLETLQQKKIFLAEPKTLNDPFDNKAYFYRPDELKKYEWLEEYDGRLIDDFSAFFRTTSLTANQVNSMPMWAHYANNHAGFCVEYDMKKNTELSSCTFPVQYTDERIDITGLMEDQVQTIMQAKSIQSSKGFKQILSDNLSLIYLVSLFCNIKHISWSYENEFRCSMASNAKGMPYAPAMPKAIYIGMNCLPTYRDKLIKIAAELQIPAYQMAFDEFNSNFNLIFKEI